jgi:SAM-dependent methyltransferase/septal ring factor EnvC (AmiA/AmiB activator)
MAEGLRKHPLHLRVTPFASIGIDDRPCVVVFEPIPTNAQTQFPTESLAKERMLHNDMLREPGRRAEAHCARYEFAAQFVRPNDRVLDIACGMGYGARTIALGSDAATVLGLDNSPFAVAYATANYGDSRVSFATADAQNLAEVPDASIDLVVSMETLEHLPEPERFLAELWRVLTPGGRVIVSVPHDWTDETGKDPNPHHLHVYAWPKLCSQLEQKFLVEQRWSQVAGGGMKLADLPRSLRQVPLDGPVNGTESVEAEWWLAVAMKRPSDGSKAQYRERIFPTAQPTNVAAFARDYDNPWLVPAMVSVGQRATGPVLMGVVNQTRKTARAGSPDHGAALCVDAYALLRDITGGGTAAADIDARLISLAQECGAFSASRDQSAHASRWAISLAYVLGQIYKSLGDADRAEAAFRACAESDCTDFSPLIATKTIDACYEWGLLLASKARTPSDLEEAARVWSAGVEQSHRLLQGDWSEVLGFALPGGSSANVTHGSSALPKPLPFGLTEAAAILDAAARCGRALAEGERWLTAPAHAVAHASQNSRTELERCRTELARLATAWQEQNAYIGLLVAEKTRLWEESRRIANEWQIVATQLGQTSAENARLKSASPQGEWEAETARIMAEWQKANARLQEMERVKNRLWEESQQLKESLDAITLTKEVVQAERDRFHKELHTWAAEAKRLSQQWEADITHFKAMLALSQQQAEQLKQELTAAQARTAELSAELASSNESQRALRAELREAHQQAEERAAQHRALEEDLTKQLQSSREHAAVLLGKYNALRSSRPVRWLTRLRLMANNLSSNVPPAATPPVQQPNNPPPQSELSERDGGRP